MNCINCDNLVIENRELQLCASCNLERRKSERAKKKVKVVHPVNKVSEKRGEELKEYPKKKKKFLEHKMICELRFEGCTQNATDVHHVSLSAKNFLNEDTWLSACRSCHSFCETKLSASQRRSLGLLTD